jgi:probable rRNA maturation factor
MLPPRRGPILAPDTSRIIESDSGTAASLGFAVPRTMILLDPDLDPDAESHSGATSPYAALRRSAFPSAEQLPTLRTLARFLAKAQAEVGLRGQVTVLLATDETIRSLNHRFRGKNKTTDVLSFPVKPLENAKPMERVAGDIAISLPAALRQGTGFGHSLGMELKVLMLHGLLHLAGYDHESDAGRMHRRERTLRKRLGLPQGLIERAEIDRGSHPKPRRTAGRASRRDAREIAPDEVRRGTRRTQSGESAPDFPKPRRGGGNTPSTVRSARP